MEKQWKQWQTLFSWAPKSLQMVTVAMKLKDAPWKKSYDQPRQYIKKQRHYSANKGPSSQSYGFSSESWTIKKGEHWKTDPFELWLEKTLESPLDCKEIKLVNPRRNQSWIFIRRTDGKAEAPVLWPPDAKSQLIGKDPGAGKDWGQEKKGMTEDEMVGWHHWLSGDEFEQAPGDFEGQGSLACCSPWGCRVRHNWATEQKQQHSNCFMQWRAWYILTHLFLITILCSRSYCFLHFKDEETKA